MEIEQEKHKREKNKKRLYIFLSFFFATLATSWILPLLLNTQERRVERLALIFFAIFLTVFLIELIIDS